MKGIRKHVTNNNNILYSQVQQCHDIHACITISTILN